MISDPHTHKHTLPHTNIQERLQYTAPQLPCSVTSSSADADKPARRVYRSVKVTKHSTIPCNTYSFLLCNNNFVFKIFDFKKCHNLEIRVRGHSRSLKVVPFGRSCMVFYQYTLVTLSIKRTVLRYWTCKHTVTLKPGLGHSRSLEMIPFNPAPMTSY